MRLAGPLLGAGLCLAAAPAAAGQPLAGIAMPRHLALTAAAGRLGSDPIYDLRLAYYPCRRLGMEATLAHNPSGDVHAALHHVNAVALLVPHGTLRPFATAGLGTIQVFPGAALNARSVTKLALNAGAGTHVFLRDDVALRLEARSFTVLDQQEGHGGAYHYLEWSGGLTFYRPLHAGGPSETGAAP
jgi:hypothetical protein